MKCMLQTVYGHFGPKTLRTQYISALPTQKFEPLRHWHFDTTRYFGTRSSSFL